MRVGLVGVRRLTAAVAATMSAAACSDAKDGGTGPKPAIDVTPSTYTLSVAPGASGAVTVALTRTGGFSGAVDITVTGAPAGVTATASPASIPPGETSSVITVVALAAATPGASTLTVHASAAGVAEKTATMALTVMPAPAVGNTAWEFCSTAALPAWFAVQDGTGAWRRITPTGTRFLFDIASGKGGVAYVTSASATSSPSVLATRSLPREGALKAGLLRRSEATAAYVASRAVAPPTSAAVDVSDLTVVYGSQPELNAHGNVQCVSEPPKTVNGTIANVATGDLADVTLGQASVTVSAIEPAFELVNVGSGPRDLVASRTTTDPYTLARVVDKMIIRRGLDLADRSTLPVLDFNAAEAFEAVAGNLTVDNAGLEPEQAFALSFYFTAGADGALSGFDGPGSGPFKYYGVPAAKQAAGDLHFALIAAFGSSDTRVAGLFFEDPTDRTIRLGPALPPPTLDVVSTTPYLRLRAAGSLAPEYDRQVMVNFAQLDRRVAISASAEYLSSASYDLTIPEFAGVAGWLDDWGLKPGVPTTWDLSAVSYTGLRVVPAEGTTLRTASTSGTIAP